MEVPALNNLFISDLAKTMFQDIHIYCVRWSTLNGPNSFLTNLETEYICSVRVNAKKLLMMVGLIVAICIFATLQLNRGQQCLLSQFSRGLLVHELTLSSS